MDQAAMQTLIDHLSKAQDLNFATAESTLCVLPSSKSIRSLEEFQTKPNRIKRTPSFGSSESFCAYVNRYKQADSSIYLDLKAGKFVAVIDHHGDAPSWQDHVASFSPDKSLQWTAWSAINKSPLGQLQFAEFIEERLDDITSPEPAAVLKAALEFQSHTNFTVASHQNLDDGTMQFNLVKENAKDTITFPHRITVNLPVHENEPLKTYDARIRFRVSGEGVLTFFFAFVQDTKMIVKHDLEAIAEKIKTNIADSFIYTGSR